MVVYWGGPGGACFYGHLLSSDSSVAYWRTARKDAIVSKLAARRNRSGPGEPDSQISEVNSGLASQKRDRWDNAAM